MPKKWKTIRLFISSTFRDMHTERDHLVRFVFPELKEKCRKHRVNLIDVDLRWGVREEDVQDERTLDICLDEIDSCRPYFIGLIGHRYGHIPSGHDHSITAQEIYHGVLHNDVLGQVVDLQRIIDGKLEGKPLSEEQVSCLVRSYEWDADKGKYLLSESASPEDIDVIKSVFKGYSTYQRDRSFFFFRSESLTKKLAGPDTEDFFEAEEADKEKLRALKQEIIDAGLPNFEYDDIEAFGSQVGDILWKRIEGELGESVEAEKDWLAEEAEFHELFIADRTRRFVGRNDLLDKMHSFCEGKGESSMMVITGESGCGKSALMGRFTEEILHNYPDWLIIPHYVGASPNSTNLRQTLKRFCTILNKANDSSEEVPEDIKELLKVFPEWIEKAAEDKKIIFILDAVNQFEKTDNAHDMRWIPQGLTDNVRFIMSTLSGDVFDSLESRRTKPNVEQVTVLNESEIRKFVSEYLKEIRHEFPNKKVERAFFNKVKHGNPLYIQVALEELRVFGKFEELAERVDSLPDNVLTLFDQVLERIEYDFNPQLVRDCMRFITCGKHGMTSEELQTLLKEHAPQMDPDTKPENLPDMIWARLYRAFSTYLLQRSGVIDFFHSQLKEAVGRRYLQKENDRKSTHKIIADYFATRWKEPYNRALQELPHQLTKSEKFDGLELILTDLQFIEAKCAAGMTYDLIEDYNTAVGVLPEAQEEKQKKLEHDKRVQKYTKDLIAYSKGEIDTLDIIPSVRPWTDEEIRADTQRIINNPTPLDKINTFFQFVSGEANNLVKYASHPMFCTQQAYNHADSGPVHEAARDSAAKDNHSIAILHKNPSLFAFNAHHACQRVLEGHSSLVQAVGITLDGRMAVSGSADLRLRVWDIETGECTHILERHLSRVLAVGITPDGSMVVTGGCDNTVRIWDLETGECQSVLEGHTGIVYAVGITPDGRMVISGSKDNTLRVWDVETGICRRVLEGHSYWVISVGVTPDGRMAVSGGHDNVLRVWDLETGECQRILEGHTDCVFAVGITPDGRMVVSGSYDNTVRVWSLETGECLRILEGHSDSVKAVEITPDGRMAVSGSDDNTLRVWDVETGICRRVLEGHSDSVKAVEITPDGCMAVLVSSDRTLSVWDIETGKCQSILEGHSGNVYAMGITPDSRMAVSGSDDRTLRVWDIETGICRRVLEGHSGSVNAVGITPDGRMAVSGSGDKTLRVWDVGTGECQRILAGESGWGRIEGITPDGRMAVLICYDKLRVWDIETGKCQLVLEEGHSEYDNAVVITPDGRMAVSGSDDNKLRVWNLKTGECQRILEGHSGSVNAVVITPDGRMAVSGSYDKTLRVWDLKTGECQRILEGHSDSVITVVITPDGCMAITYSCDETLRVWDIEGGNCLAIYKGNDHMNSISMSRNEGDVVIGTKLGQVIFAGIRNLTLETPVVTASYLWLFGLHGKEGSWSDSPTCNCFHCGRRFTPDASLLDTIARIAEKHNLSPDQSPCTELPPDAWNESQLLSECPHCQKPLKFNPFIVDNRDRY